MKYCKCKGKHERTKIDGEWTCDNCGLEFLDKDKNTKSKKYWIAVDEKGNLADCTFYDTKEELLEYVDLIPVRATLTYVIERNKK